MTTPQQRLDMAKAIVDFEARRDRNGHLAVYYLPPGDGGGRYEVAGINERYDKPVVDKLVELLRDGRYGEAELEAQEYIAANTDPAAKLTSIPSLESYLRDTVFNRGVRGATRTLQMALGVSSDGIFGPKSRKAMVDAEKDPPALLQKLRDAREHYERVVVGRDEDSIFWRGLVNRWDKALKVAQSFPNSDGSTTPSLPQAPIPDTSPVPAPFQQPHQTSWWLDTVERGKHFLAKFNDENGPIPPANSPKAFAAAAEVHTLGQRIKQTMLSKGYPWFTGDKELNIVAVEGMDPDGSPNQNRPNAFDDIKMVLTGDGVVVGGPYEATTEPGRFWTEHPMNPAGAFHISLGPQTCWIAGEYHDMPALIQADDIIGTRDRDEDYQREGPVVKGMFGVHHHGGYNYPRDDMGRSSAGCQVIRLMDRHYEFMRLVKTDPRYRADPDQFRFTATVLQADEVLP